MPKILTSAFRNTIFFLPYSRDKSEGVYCKPITQTRRNEIRRNAMVEAGMDSDIGEAYWCRDMLKETILDWKGFWSPTGEAIPCTPEAIADMCESDPVFAMTMLTRILSIARTGDLEDQKN